MNEGISHQLFHEYLTRLYHAADMFLWNLSSGLDRRFARRAPEDHSRGGACVGGHRISYWLIVGQQLNSEAPTHTIDIVLELTTPCARLTKSVSTFMFSLAPGDPSD